MGFLIIGEFAEGEETMALPDNIMPPEEPIYDL